MTCHYPIPSCSAEHEPRERKDRADISGISHSAFACFMLRGFTRLMLDCHLVLLIRSLFQEHLKYPVNPHPQILWKGFPWEQYSLQCPGSTTARGNEQLLTLSVSLIILLISLISPLHQLCLGCSRLSK